MSDHQPHPPADLDPTTALRRRRQRARSIVMAAALLLWALVIYIAIMFRIDMDIRHPPSSTLSLPAEKG
jgi:ferric-dicitrate binding protein FerR (iron transport regulator)